MKKIIILGSIFIITGLSANQDICVKAYSYINKHTQRADVFLKEKDWEMANFYLRKLKTDYTVFIKKDCFDKVFKKTNQKRMKGIYRKNVRDIRNLEEMTEETIREKKRIDREKAIQQIDLEAARKKEAIKREIREEMMREGK